MKCALCRAAGGSVQAHQSEICVFTVSLMRLGDSEPLPLCADCKESLETLLAEWKASRISRRGIVKDQNGHDAHFKL